MHKQRLAYTVEEAAQILGISRSSAYEAARKGEIPIIRIGKLLRVPAIQLDRLLNGQSTKKNSPKFDD
jgi:excisionase family DNA binding protein